MNALLRALALGLVLLSCAPREWPPVAEWERQAFRDGALSLSARFPVAAEKSASRQGFLDSVDWFVQRGDERLNLGIVSGFAEAPGFKDLTAEQKLDKAVLAMAQLFGGSVTRTAPVQIGPHAGLAFEIAAGRLGVRGQLLFHYDRLVVIHAVFPTGDPLASAFDEFVRSLEVAV